MNLISKSAIALTTLGGVSLTGAYAGGLFNKSPSQQTTIIKTTFKEKLKTEGFTVLDTSQGGDDWNTILEIYKTATTRSFSGNSESDKTEDKLRADCENAWKLIENLNDNYLENENYKKAMQWCVKKEKMNEIFENGGLRVLKIFEKNDSQEQGLLQKKLNQLKENSQEKFNALKAIASSSIGNSNEVNKDNLNKGCEALKINTLETTDNEFLNNYYLAKEFCYVNKDNP